MIKKYKDKKTIYVYENWSSDNPKLLGILTVQLSKGEEVFSFSYDLNWLKNNKISILDPSLSFYEGPQYLDVSRKQFGIFMDSAPDRWGRMLMNRKEKSISKEESISLKESDYLLGVEDYTRMGALRLSLTENGPFLSNDSEMKTPPLENLRDLEYAAYEYEKDENYLKEKWIKLLLAPGSSLGGSRPKANVIDNDKNLWIAKFPSKNDEIDVGAWEFVAHELAKMCSLNVPEAKLLKLSNRGSTFLSKRFDRIKEKRIHFASAMTLLEKIDGESNECSYLDIADFIKSYGINPEEDLKELWKRMVFNILIKNTDDHLRNHGFILEKYGWKLSPLFDVNPNPEGTNLSLNIIGNNNELDVNLAIKIASYYGINERDATTIANEMKSTIKNNWESIAKKNGILEKSIAYMSSAFKN